MIERITTALVITITEVIATVAECSSNSNGNNSSDQDSNKIWHV